MFRKGQVGVCKHGIYQNTENTVTKFVMSIFGKKSALRFMQSTHVTEEIQGGEITDQVLLRFLREAIGARGPDGVSEADFDVWYHFNKLFFDCLIEVCAIGG
jgi:hypothetical protein